MREALGRAIQAASGYVELRLRRRWSTAVVFRRQRIEVATEYHAFGGVARVLIPGHGWGAVAFADPEQATAAVRRAAELSQETRPDRPIALAPIPIRQIDLPSDLSDDPRLVPLTQKREVLEQWTAELLATDRRVGDSRTSYGDTVVETWLATSEGVWLHDLNAETSTAAIAMATEGGSTERAIGSFAARGGFGQVLAGAAIFPSTAQRAVERLTAKMVAPGRYPIVLDPRASGGLVLQGVVNLCRARSRGLERERLPLGTRIGPDLLSVGDDPTAPGLRTSLVLDDEGTPVAPQMLVQNGVVVGHLHTRESAALDAAAPTGHALAPTLRSIPMPRPTNPYLVKGSGDLGALLGDISLGVYLGDLVGLSIEGRQVTIVPGVGTMIRQGVLAESVKCPPISVDLFTLFGRLDKVGGDFSWDTGATGLHDAGPLRPITTGAPHTRFLDLEVGALYA